MDRKYPMITAAVAAALAGGYAGSALAQPTIAQAAAAPATLVISGSSAAQSSIANTVETTLCGGSGYLAIESNASSDANKNFYAWSCNIAVAAGSLPVGTLATIYYRSEGGSVTGALPIVDEKEIKRLDLTSTLCSASGTVGTCTVTGVTASNGPNDSWSGAVTEAYVQLGVTDVEPAQLINDDYPSNYATSVFGSATPAQMANLSTNSKAVIQQVFGIAVNTHGMDLNTAQNGSGIHLSRESVANILNGNYTDWSVVPDAATGDPITTSPAGIVHVDREPGSGTRTSANIYFLNYGCSATATAAIPPGGYTYQPNEPLNYSTGDELTLANSTNASISYASIDNLTSPKNSAYPNLVLAQINGVTPSNLAAAAGEYDYWYEATVVPNTAELSGNSAQLADWLVSNLPKLSAAPAATDINVIPNAVPGYNLPTVPLTTGGSSSITIYVNPFTRGKASCAVPSEEN